MATADLGEQFSNRVREIVQPLIDEAVERILSAALGTTAAPAKRRGRPPGSKNTTARTNAGVACGVAGCPRPVRSKGYCAAHYQAARKYGYPIPGKPGNFAPEPRKRGRPFGSSNKKASAKASPAAKTAAKAKPGRKASRKAGRKGGAARKTAAKTTTAPAATA